MSDKRVKVKSLVKGIVGIKSQDLRVNLTWNKRGAVRNVDFDTLRDLIYEEGVEYMFKEGILGIDDMDKCEYLKKKTGIDAISAIRLRRQAKEPVKSK